MLLRTKFGTHDLAGVTAETPRETSRLGLALETIGSLPINGLRHSETERTCGWYIWCGSDLSDDRCFFSPLHVVHISEYLPQVIPFLDLPPGYRFQIDGAGYEDIWFDNSLITA